jgi:UDP-N-acetylmuramyl tripeptide synthase
MKKTIAIMAAKLAILAGKVLKRGSSLPGYIAIRIDEEIGKKLDTSQATIIAVTGANGKSTTTTLLAKILTQNGFVVAANLRGSNMRPGVFTGILAKTTLRGKVKADVIIMEVDEFSSPKVYSAIKPDYLVVLNVLRDHIERQSDTSNVIAKIEAELDETTTLVLNADDPIVRSIANDLPNKALFFGIDDLTYGSAVAPKTPLAGKFCFQCGAKLTYSHYYYEHLGHYDCPSCDFGRPVCDYAATMVQVDEHTLVVNETEKYTVNYDAFYMYYNVLASVYMARLLGLDPTKIEAVANSFIVGNARLEQFYLHERVGVMNFLKNATSLSATIDLLTEDKADKTLVFVMDDTYDGRYFITQWYWDADVEKLAQDTSIKYFVCTWRRGYDMAVRLKAAGVAEERIIVELDVERAIAILREQTVGNVYLGYDTDSHSISKVVAALAKYPENAHLRR